MKPSVKVALSILTFVAMVLTGLAAAEQVPTTQPKGNESLLSPDFISLSPKLVRKKPQPRTNEKSIQEIDTLNPKQKRSY